MLLSGVHIYLVKVIFVDIQSIDLAFEHAVLHDRKFMVCEGYRLHLELYQS